MIAHEVHCRCEECDAERERVDQVADLIREKEGLIAQKKKLRDALTVALLALDQEALTVERRKRKPCTNCSPWAQVRAIGRKALEETEN